MKFFAEEILNGKLHFLCSEHLFSHFLMAVHEEFLNTVSITFIDKTDPSDPYREKITEDKHLKMVSYGLNMEDSVLCVFLCLLFYMVFLHGYVSTF